MVEFGLPVMQSDVNKPVRPEHLVPRAPRSSWDGWFAIAIFPDDSPVRWLKAHLFRRACRPGWHPLAAIEGLDERSEMLIAWAGAEGVEVLERGVEGETPEASSSPLRVSLEGRFLLEGTAPRYSMAFSMPGGQAGARFSFEAGWPIWWSRFGRALGYVGQHCATSVSLDHEASEKKLEGFGVMEHVCGISLPFDFTRLLPFHYHWDVLAFHTPGSPFDSAAGLSIGRRGETILRLKAAARLPGGRPEAMRGLSVRYLELSRTKNSHGAEIVVPVRWEGAMRGREGEFRYTAGSSTPVAPILPGGGMLGFDFEGEWVSPVTGVEAWRGTGFTEYGDFSGRLLDLSSRPDPC